MIVTPGVADVFRARAAVNAAIRQELTGQVSHVARMDLRVRIRFLGQ